MDIQLAALQEKLTEERLTPGGLEAAGGSSRSKHCFKSGNALMAVIALLIVVLVTTVIFCYSGSAQPCTPHCPCNHTGSTGLQLAKPNQCTTFILEEGDRNTTFEIFTADEGRDFFVTGWANITEGTEMSFKRSVRKGGQKDENVDRQLEMEQKKLEDITYFFTKLKMTESTKLIVEFTLGIGTDLPKGQIHVC